MGRLSDFEKHKLKVGKSQKALAEKAARRSERLIERRKLNLERNLIREHRSAINKVREADDFNRLIKLEDLNIPSMDVAKYEAKRWAADRKLDSVTGEYDADDE